MTKRLENKRVIITGILVAGMTLYYSIMTSESSGQTSLSNYPPGNQAEQGVEQRKTTMSKKNYLKTSDLIAEIQPFLEQAWNCEKEGILKDAENIYKTKLAGEKNELLSIFCRQGLQRCAAMRSAFSCNLEALWDNLKKEYPDLSRTRFDSYVTNGDIYARRLDGEIRYESSAGSNLCYRDQWVREHNPAFLKNNQILFNNLEPWFMSQRGAKPEWIPYQLTLEFSAAKKDLPPGNIIRLWFPCPLEKPGMTEIKIIAVHPDKALKNEPEVKGDLGIAYLELPYPDTEELKASITLAFKTRPIRTVIDYNHSRPDDTNSEIYKTFTRSEQHTLVTPQTTALAQKLTANENHPARKAKIIYDYILDNYFYGYNSAWRSTIFSPFESASETVPRLKAGDCVTQSCFFTALCRSIGIPARVTGGRLFITNEINNDHFWAEFFMPEYGWIPVDTTIPIALLLNPNLTQQQRDAIREYYFGGLDPFRLVTHRSELYIELVPPKRSERRREAFLATFVEAECDGQNINQTKLKYNYLAQPNFNQ